MTDFTVKKFVYKVECDALSSNDVDEVVRKTLDWSAGPNAAIVIFDSAQQTVATVREGNIISSYLEPSFVTGVSRATKERMIRDAIKLSIKQ